jgi:hypothetical protein
VTTAPLINNDPTSDGSNYICLVKQNLLNTRLSDLIQYTL